ncbi:cytochrome P450 [Solimonas soli]|uniref:cytochrome P450 n=1 Tax=Solimonas soli TaxID=413479 RepID=UPI0004AD5CE5|nr:cytochrome P450 [Solimonas soli]
MSAEPIEETMRAFDHTAPAQMNDPYAMYEAFRTRCPVGRSGQHGGFFVVSRYESVKKVFEDYSTFSSTQGVGIPPHPYQMFPIDLDPPLQTKFRRVLNRRFTPEAVATKRDEIQRVIDALIDDFIETGSADLAAQLVRPLLPRIVLPLLGVPSEARQQMSEWIEYMTRGRATDMPGVIKAGEDITMFLGGLVARRRSAPPVDDVLGAMLEAQIDGRPFSDDEILRTLLIILFGGLDTTSAVMLESLLHLARHPQDKERLKSGATPWSLAIEELVRYTSPIQGLRRTVTQDTRIEGQDLKAGDWVFGLHGSANRDEAVFERAAQCVLERQPNPHVAFGSGAHICLGRNLARLEIEILLKTVLERFGDYEVAADFAPEYLVGEARGMKSLPVRFVPAQRSAWLDAKRRFTAEDTSSRP